MGSWSKWMKDLIAKYVPILVIPGRPGVGMGFLGRGHYHPLGLGEKFWLDLRELWHSKVATENLKLLAPIGMMKALMAMSHLRQDDNELAYQSLSSSPLHPALPPFSQNAQS